MSSSRSPVKRLSADIPDERETLRRLFQIKRTELQMLNTRGYDLSEVVMEINDNPVKVDLRFMLDDSLGLTDEFTDDLPYFSYMLEYRNSTGLFASRKDFSAVYPEGLVVLYLLSKPGKAVSAAEFQVVSKYIQLANTSGVFKRFILISKNGLSVDNRSKISDRYSSYPFEHFYDHELGFNRLNHALAPISIKHIPSADVAEWGREEEVQPEKMPMIISQDIVSRWYGASAMDVFQTEIVGSTTDTEGYARIVRMTSADDTKLAPKYK